MELKEKIINGLTQIKHQNLSKSFVIDDSIERINKAGKKRNSLTELYALLMNETMGSDIQVILIDRKLAKTKRK